MGHQEIAVNDMCEEDKIEGLQTHIPAPHLLAKEAFFVFIFLFSQELWSFSNKNLDEKLGSSYLF